MEPSAQTGGSAVHAAQEQQHIPDVTFKLQFGRTCTDISMPLSATVGDLKEQAHQLLGIPPAMQKLLIKGSLKSDVTTLQNAGVKKGLRIMLVGSRCPSHLTCSLYYSFTFRVLTNVVCHRPQDILSAAAPSTASGLSWDPPILPEEDPVHTQPQHKKVYKHVFVK